jgi:hypothetical protein
MAGPRQHYPVTSYVLVLLCALGLAAVAIGIADGWLLIATGVPALVVSLARLHVTLQRRRPGRDTGFRGPKRRRQRAAGKRTVCDRP